MHLVCGRGGGGSSIMIWFANYLGEVQPFMKKTVKAKSPQRIDEEMQRVVSLIHVIGSNSQGETELSMLKSDRSFEGGGPVFLVISD